MYNITTNTLFVGKKIVYLPTCQSTNTIAAQLASSMPLEEGSIVITDFQTAGRGQFGSQWDAHAGQNLLFSLLLKPSFLPAKDIFALNMAVSLAVFKFIKELVGGENIAIKWPNDMLINNQKTAGILIENNWQGHKLYQSIVGIGLNVNQTQFDTLYPTSLALQTGAHHNLDYLLSQLASHLEAQYLSLKAGHKDTIRKQYLDNIYLMGKCALFCLPSPNQSPFEAVLEDICPSGRLILHTSDHQILYFNPKEIIFVK